MQRKNVFWGSVLIISALLIIAAAILSGKGILSGVPLVSLIFGVLCLAAIVSALAHRQVAGIYFPIAFIYILFRKEIAQLAGITNGELISGWIVLLCALLLTVGTGILTSGTKKTDYIIENGDDCNRNKNIKSGSLRYIDGTSFVNESIEVSMSKSDVFFENIENYPGGGTLLIESNMSSLTIHVPKTWHLVSNISNNLGVVSIPSCGAPDGKVIYINGENNMGKVDIVLS